MQMLQDVKSQSGIEYSLKKWSNIERKKHIQKVKLIKYVFNRGATPITEFISALNISAPTCQIIINELLNEGLVERKGKGGSIGGRRPDLYALKDGCFYVLGFSMERFATQVAIIDNNNNILKTATFPIAISTDLSVIDQLYTVGLKMIADTEIDQRKIAGAGFAMPGLINWQTGNNQSYLATGNDDNLQTQLEEKFKLPVYIQNDVKCAATAELNYGLAKGVNDALVVLMDWGIGLGIIMDGKMQKGSQGFSGEIGHIPFVENGALCYCGKRGCLETVASGIALTRMAKEGIEAGQYTMLNELSEGNLDKIQPGLIITAANKGDQYAISLLSNIGHNLGKGIATLIQLFNPEKIILGGKIAEAKQYITIPIIQAINTYTMMQIRETTSVVLSNLGLNLSILGIVNMVIDNTLEKQAGSMDNL